jgi:hypothetical protein
MTRLRRRATCQLKSDFGLPPHSRCDPPDLASMAQLILEPMCPRYNSYLEFVAAFHAKSRISSGDAINYLFYHCGRRYIYTTAELRRHFEEAGFRPILEARAGHPSADVFRGVGTAIGFAQIIA